MPLKDPAARRAYHAAYMKKYLSDPEHYRKHLVRVRRNEALRADILRPYVLEFKAKGCLLCPEKTPCCLSAHHLDPSGKDFDISMACKKGVSIEALKAELEKCVCVCENCHRKIHAGVLTVPDRLAIMTEPT